MLALLSPWAMNTPWTDMVGARAIDHYRSIMKYCRIEAALPDNVVLSHCDGKFGNMSLIAAEGKQYLVYEGL